MALSVRPRLHPEKPPRAIKKDTDRPASSLQWKSFDFFDVSQVKLADDDETRAFFDSNEISSVCSGSDSLFLGSSDGHVRIVGPSWRIVRSFQAHEGVRVSHMRQVEGTSLLVTVGVRYIYIYAHYSIVLDDALEDHGADLLCSTGGPQRRACAEGLGSGQAGQEDGHADLPEQRDNLQWKETVSCS